MNRPLWSLSVRDPLFAHWRVGPDAIGPHLPDALALDRFDGDAYVSVVAAELAPRSRGCAYLSLPSVVQVTLRTYVERDDTPGVYFFSLDTGDALVAAVGRSLWLPCHRARTRLRRAGDEFRVGAQRTQRGVPPAHFAATVRPEGESSTAEPDSLAAFLVERYRWFAEEQETATDRSVAERSTTGRVEHAPWSIAPASMHVHANTLFDAAGLDRPGEPALVHVADAVDATIGDVERVGGSTADEPIEIEL